MKALLDDILAAPDDDGPRLAYADWLLEQGDPRGEYIRTQLDTRRLPLDDPRRGPLEEREAELHDAHGETWEAPLRDLVRDTTFSRGFLQGVSLTFEQLLSHGARLLDEHPIEHLAVEVQEDQVAKLAALPLLGRVRVLEVLGVTDEAVTKLAKSKHLRGLRGLILGGNALGDDAAVVIAERLGDLELLDLSDNQIGARGAAAIAKMTRLEGLDLHANLLGDDGYAALAKGSLPSLRRLCLGRNGAGDEGLVAFAGGPFVPALRQLGLGILALNWLPYRIARFHLGEPTKTSCYMNEHSPFFGGEPGDLQASWNAESLGKLLSLAVGLEGLDISTAVDDDDILAIAAAPRPALATLGAIGAQLTREPLEQLIQSAGALSFVDVRTTTLPADGLEVMSNFPGFATWLCELHTGKAIESREDAEAFAAALPRLAWVRDLVFDEEIEPELLEIIERARE
jgi:uncharacterized protein (TIGR02996 family)